MNYKKKKKKKKNANLLKYFNFGLAHHPDAGKVWGRVLSAVHWLLVTSAVPTSYQLTVWSSVILTAI